MSIYPLFIQASQRYEVSVMHYETLLKEREDIFSRTQPQGIRYDRDKVMTSPNGDPFTAYMAEMERTGLQKRIETARTIMTDYKAIRDEREASLRRSKDLYDKIYRMRYLDHLKPLYIARRIGYSKSEIYRKLDSIEKKMGKYGNNRMI
jgi:hypothetical protein